MDPDYDQTRAESIERFGQKLLGKTLRTQRGIKAIPEQYKFVQEGKRSKGGFGKALEYYYFGINPGNESAPDFPKAGTELKSTGIKLLKRGGFSAKERLVLNIINFEKEGEVERFEESSFYKKNRKIMLVSYEFAEGRAIADHPIRVAKIVRFEDLPLADQLVIRHDWEKIRDTIRENRAETLSEGATDYLGACTKGGDASQTRNQAGAGIRAKQRAFSLKAGYMSILLRRLWQPDKSVVYAPAIKNADELKSKPLENRLLEKFEPYIGKTIEEVYAGMNAKPKISSKGFAANLVAKILGTGDKEVEELLKAEIIVKTIRMNHRGTVLQNMSFPTFKFAKLIEEIWDTEDQDREAEFKKILESRFMIVVFESANQKEAREKDRIAKVFFWNMPYEDRLEARKVWERAVVATRASKPENLPKQKENAIAHVRPHGRTGVDVDTLPDGSETTKRCFWLNARYIKKQIQEADS